MRSRLGCFLVALTIAAFEGGCDLPDGTPTNSLTETFVGTIVPQGSSVYVFTVLSTGFVSVQLSRVDPATVTLGLGIGTRKSDSCTMTTSIPSAAADTLPQISVSENAGQYCVQVFDTGAVSGATTFSVVIKHN